MDGWFYRKIDSFRWLVRDFPKWKGESERRVYSINETSAASAIVKSALNIITTCDSYYQTTNKRKNNPKVLINIDKLKYALFDCGLHMYFRFQT